MSFDANVAIRIRFMQGLFLEKCFSNFSKFFPNFSKKVFPNFSNFSKYFSNFSKFLEKYFWKNWKNISPKIVPGSITIDCNLSKQHSWNNFFLGIVFCEVIMV